MDFDLLITAIPILSSHEVHQFIVDPSPMREEEPASWAKIDIESEFQEQLYEMGLNVVSSSTYLSG